MIAEVIYKDVEFNLFVKIEQIDNQQSAERRTFIHCLLCGHLWISLKEDARNIKFCAKCKTTAFATFPAGFNIKKCKCLLCAIQYKTILCELGEVKRIKPRRSGWSMHETPDLSRFVNGSEAA